LTSAERAAIGRLHDGVATRRASWSLRPGHSSLLATRSSSTVDARPQSRLIPMYRPDLETASPDTIRARQLDRLNALLAAILPANRFYADKYRGIRLPLTWDRFRALPFTTKDELVADQAAHPPFGTIATYGREGYVAYHQTSGTTGQPLMVPDTRESWAWWAECWQYIYRAAGVTARDRVFFAFSFGPFIGFWSAYAGAQRLGALAIPGGGLDSKARLQLLLRTAATVLVCTPTYALRLAEVALAEELPIRESAVRVTIHAGEPGASIPEVRARIEEAWGARCYDHAGATEVGAYGYTCERQAALHVNEAEFIAEVLSTNGEAVGEGEIGELVITNLGRAGWPVVRYRTGDLVRVGGRACPCGRTFLALPGGLIGRADDLIVLRGVNVYPSAIEAIVRCFDVQEFRLVRTRRGALEELRLEVEADAQVADRLAERLHQQLGVRIPTRAVAPGSLPRWELKARRVLDLRNQPESPAESVADTERPRPRTAS
jgi:phenylacetate-CoA ligase